MADTDPAIAALTQQLAQLSAALLRAEERAKASAEASKKNAAEKKAEAAEAEKLSSKLGDAARAATGVTEASKTSSAAALTLKNAFANLVREGIEHAVSGMEEFVRNLPEAAARSERHAQALHQLGGAYDAVRQATNGAVSAEQAAAVQQRVAQSGIQLTARELAAVTQRAREYARATGTDLGQALEQLADNIVDPGEELRKFGVFLRQGLNDGDKLTETLRQLTRQADTTARSQLSLNESMEAASRAQREASDAVAGLLAQRLELADFFTQLTSWLDGARTSTDGWKTATEAVVGTLREAVGLRVRSGLDIARDGQAVNQSASGQFTGEAGALAQQVRARGLSLGGFQLGQFGVRASEQQRAGMMALLRQAAAGGVTQEQLAAQLNELGGRADERADDAQATRAATTAAAAAARRREIRRRNQASASPSNATPDGQLLTVGSGAIDAIMSSLIERGGGLALRDDPNLDQGVQREQNAEALQRFRDRQARERDARRRERDAADRGYDRSQLDEQVGTVNTRSQLAMAESQARTTSAGRDLPLSAGARARAEEERNRIQILREQGNALRELYDANVQLEEQQRGAGATQAEINQVLQQRIGLQTALAENSRALAESQASVGTAMEAIGGRLISTLEGTTDAMGEAVVAAIEGSKSFGEAMHAMVYDALRALTKLAVVEAIKETAMGLAALATYRFDAMGAHFAAAGTWVGVGVASGLGLAAMPNPNAQKPAAPAAGAGDRGAARADRPAQADRSQGGPLVMNFNVSGAAFTDAGVQAAAGAILREAQANGYFQLQGN